LNVYTKLWMKFLSIRLFEKKLIGRWFVKTKQSQINRVVDLANFDHCGACGSIDQILQDVKRKRSTNRV